MSEGKVHVANKAGHPIQARRLPVISDFTEEQLEKGDTSWMENYLSIENIKQIQHHTTSSPRNTWSSTSSTRTNLWLLTFLYFASIAGAMDEKEDEAQCSAGEASHQEWHPQAFLMSVMVIAIFCLTYVLFWTRRTLDQLRCYVQIHVVDEVTPLVYRVMDLERTEMQTRGDLDQLLRQAAEARGDLDTLFRAMRLASPHLDEPSQQRRHLVDTRPPVAEPDCEISHEDSPQPAEEEDEASSEDENEIDRLVALARRSRSGNDNLHHDRDLHAGAGGSGDRALHADTGGGHGPHGGEDPEEEMMEEDDEFAAFPHGTDTDDEFEQRNERERQRQEANLRIHYMLIQANNLGVELHTAGRRYPNGRIPFGRIEQLYVEHAPFFPLPLTNPEEEDITVGYFRNEHFYVLRIGNEQPLNFRSLEGLHGYRCHHIIAERDMRLSPQERRDRLYNLLQHYQRI